MPRVLNSKEQAVLARFKKHNPTNVALDTMTFSNAGVMYNIVDPVVMKLGDSDDLLVFGEIRKSMSMDELKRWVEQQIKAGTIKGEGAPSEIDGDSHTCGAGCTHEEAEAGEHHQHSTESDVECVEENVKGEEHDSNIKEEDVKLIMEQVSVSREEVVAALKNSNYDVVSALVDLTKRN